MCENYGCRIMAAMCVRRQAQANGSWASGVVRRVPYDLYCASGKCDQGRRIAAALEEGDMEALKEYAAAEPVIDRATPARPAAVPAVPKKTCNLCKKPLPITEFRPAANNPNRRISTCRTCDERYNRAPRRSRAAAAALKKPAAQGMVPDVLDGFVRCDPGIASGEAFMTLCVRGISLSAAVVRRICPDGGQADIYVHQATGRVAVVPTPKGRFKITVKRGSASIACKVAMDAYKIKPVGRVPVEITGGVVVGGAS